MTRQERTDLGLDIAHALNRGKRLTAEEIAAYCECSSSAISQIERRALKKVRRALKRRGLAQEFADGL
jgi:DNA-directed RNA polymerase sigma subunit (sigma70/sigma32)